MNKFAFAKCASDNISSIKKVISEGIMIYSCLTFSTSNGNYNFYRHGEISHFVCKMACLLFISSHTCPEVHLSRLAQSIAQHLMCYAACNSNEKLVLSKALNSDFIYDVSTTAGEVLSKFSKAHLCKVNIQRAFALIQPNESSSNFLTT